MATTEPTNKCECGHADFNHEIDGHCKICPCDQYSTKSKMGPGYDPRFDSFEKALEKVTTRLKQSDRNVAALHEEHQTILDQLEKVEEAEGNGRLTITFSGLTSEEARMILTNALKGHNKLDTIAYSEESETN